MAYRQNGKGIMPAAAVLLLTVLFFLPGLSYDFLLWDDSLFVVDNPRIGLTWENIRWYATEPFFNLYTPLPLYSRAKRESG